MRDHDYESKEGAIIKDFRGDLERNSKAGPQIPFDKEVPELFTLDRSRGVFIPRSFVRWTGNIVAAYMLSQLVYWTRRTRNRYRWIHKTMEEWVIELGIHRSQQKHGRDVLKERGLLEEYKTGIPPKVYYRLTSAFYDLYESGQYAVEDRPTVRPKIGRSSGLKSALCVHNARGQVRVLQKTTNKHHRDERGGGATLGIVNGESSIFKACTKFAKFLQNRHGDSVKRTTSTYIVQKRWVVEASNYIAFQLNGDADRLINTLRWYRNNVNTNNFLGECLSLNGFLKKFHQIEKQKRLSEGDKVSTGATIIKKIVGPVRHV